MFLLFITTIYFSFLFFKFIMKFIFYFNYFLFIFVYLYYYCIGFNCPFIISFIDFFYLLPYSVSSMLPLFFLHVLIFLVYEFRLYQKILHLRFCRRKFKKFDINMVKIWDSYEYYQNSSFMLNFFILLFAFIFTLVLILLFSVFLFLFSLFSLLLLFYIYICLHYSFFINLYNYKIKKNNLIIIFTFFYYFTLLHLYVLLILFIIIIISSIFLLILF